MFTSKKSIEKSKRNAGFTLTEMVIVIAVIAILAAVLIPTFIGVSNRAKLSADVQAASNATTIAKTVVTGNENATLQEIYSAIADERIDLSKTQSSNYRFAYDSNQSEVVLLNENLEIVENERVSTAVGTNLWFFVRSGDDIIAADKLRGKIYTSNYFLTQNYTGTLQINTLSGFDTGSSTLTGTVNYGTTTASIPSAGNVTVNGNINGTLFINASAAEFTQNGTVKTINAYAVAPNSLTVKGSVQTLSVRYGHIKVAQSAIVSTLSIPAEAANQSAKVTNNGYITKLEVAEIINDEASTKTIVTNYAVIEKAVTVAQDNTEGEVSGSLAGQVANGDLTDYEYAIGSYEQLCAFRDAVNGGARFTGVTVTLTSDIVLQNGWTPIGAFPRNTNQLSFNGTFDGGNKKISNLNNTGYYPSSEAGTFKNTSTLPGKREYVYGLFGVVNNATIKNVNLVDVSINIENNKTYYGDKVAALVGYSNGNLTIENCHVKNGTISAFDAVAGLVGGAYQGTKDVVEGDASLVIKSSSNAANIIGAEKAAGIVGYVSLKGTVSITEVTNTGSVTVEWAGKNGNDRAHASGILTYAIGSTNIGTGKEASAKIYMANVTSNGNVTVNYTLADENKKDVNYAVAANLFALGNGISAETTYRGLVAFTGCEVGNETTITVNNNVVKNVMDEFTPVE